MKTPKLFPLQWPRHWRIILPQRTAPDLALFVPGKIAGKMVQPRPGLSCEECPFSTGLGCKISDRYKILPCVAAERSDRTNVVFVEVKR